MSRSALQSTSVFYQASPGVRVFRFMLAASQRLWPSLAVRAAYRLFGTPLPPKWLNRRVQWDASWRVERWPFEQASVTIYSQPLAPPGPIVLLVHGWGGHARQMLPLAEALGQQGLRPVLLEMPAHGRSSGAVSNLPQFARAIEYVAARLSHQGHRLRAVVAHSLAANAAAYAASTGLAAERLVLLAPPASPLEYTRLFAHVFGLSETTRTAMQQRIEEREGILMHELEPDAVGPRIRVPTLVVHDRQDSINRFADGMAYAHAIRGAQLVATEGLGHRKILKDAQVIGKVAIFAA
jgi:pimeloyl-ACP methyl ester carboxylesterase